MSALAAWSATCSAAPADYTGADPVVDELRDVRREAAAACAVTAERLEKLTEGFGWSPSSGIWLSTPTGNGPTGRLKGIVDALGTVTTSNTVLGQLGGSGSQLSTSLGARLQTLLDRTGDVTSPAAGSVNARLGSIATATAASDTKLAGTLSSALTRGADALTPLYVSGGAGGGSVDTTDLELVTEESSEAVRSSLWFLGGLLLVLLTVPFLVRTFQP